MSKMQLLDLHEHTQGLTDNAGSLAELQWILVAYQIKFKLK